MEIIILVIILNFIKTWITPLQQMIYGWDGVDLGSNFLAKKQLKCHSVSNNLKLFLSNLFSRKFMHC